MDVCSRWDSQQPLKAADCPSGEGLILLGIQMGERVHSGGYFEMLRSSVIIILWSQNL